MSPSAAGRQRHESCRRAPASQLELAAQECLGDQDDGEARLNAVDPARGY